MLQPLHRVLRRAQRHGYAVGAFNTSNLEMTQAILEAASRLRSPVIVNVTEKAIAYAGLEAIAGLVRTLAARRTIPIVLNLDHGQRPELARRALAVGFGGIMLDASRHAFATNVRWTRQVVRSARRAGAGVEGELGVVAYPGERVALSDVAQSVRYVRETGVHAFAVGIGNRHGAPVRGERLDLGRLAELRRSIPVPLVLHGASGTPAATLRRCIRLGICKVNIDTDLRIAFTARLRRTLSRDRAAYDPRAVLAPSRDAVQRVVESKLRTLGSVRRG